MELVELLLVAGWLCLFVWGGRGVVRMNFATLATCDASRKTCRVEKQSPNCAERGFQASKNRSSPRPAFWQPKNSPNVRFCKAKSLKVCLKVCLPAVLPALLPACPSACLPAYLPICQPAFSRPTKRTNAQTHLPTYLRTYLPAAAAVASHASQQASQPAKQPTNQPCDTTKSLPKQTNKQPHNQQCQTPTARLPHSKYKRTPPRV